MAKLNDTQAFERHKLEIINKRWSELWMQEREWARGVLHYLFLTNAGGAAATLSYLAASGAGGPSSGAPWSLALFLFGLMLVGVVALWGFHHLEQIFRGWREDTEKYQRNEMSWSELNLRDDDRAANPNTPICLAWLSFACFVVGAVLGAGSIVAAS